MTGFLICLVTRFVSLFPCLLLLVNVKNLAVANEILNGILAGAAVFACIIAYKSPLVLALCLFLVRGDVLPLEVRVHIHDQFIFQFKFSKCAVGLRDTTVCFLGDGCDTGPDIWITGAQSPEYIAFYPVDALWIP